MKTKMLVTALTVAALSMGAIEVKAQEKSKQEETKQELKTEEFKVGGNCGMCKKRIEGSLAGVDGVESANWDTDTKTMTISFKEGAISLDDICIRIAEAGHDTPWYTAKDEVYNKLHGCCQYERLQK